MPNKPTEMPQEFFVNKSDGAIVIGYGDDHAHLTQIALTTAHAKKLVKLINKTIKQ